MSSLMIAAPITEMADPDTASALSATAELDRSSL